MKEFIGDLWMDRAEDGRVKIGFARRFIEDRMGECFHVMQADTRNVKKGGPLLVIETNDGLRPVKSPLTGSILFFNHNARNFPDKLVEDDCILEVLPEGVKLPSVTVKKAKAPTNNWANGGVLGDLWADNQPPTFDEAVNNARRVAQVRAQQGVLPPRPARRVR